MRYIVFLIIFAACTIGGEEPQGVVSLESSDVTVVEEEELSFEEGVLEFSQCMREEGIDFPDPSFDVDGNPNFDEVQVDNEEEFEEAFIACEDILRNAFPDEFDVDPEVEAALIDASLEFSQCMRDQGIDFPDPKPGEFGSLLSEMQILTLTQKLSKRLLKSVNLRIHLRTWMNNV